MTLLLLTTPTWAAPILGVTASTTNATAPGTNILDTANGSGLVPGQVATATHAQSAFGNAWATLDAIPTVNLTFDLNGLFNLAGMSIWNGNGPARSRGINGVAVSSSTDGVLFNPIFGAPVAFAPGPIATATPSLADGTFAWAPVLATHVRFNVASTHGGSNVAFNEVLFDGTAAAAGVPEIGREGAKTALLFVGLTLLFLTGGRKPVSEARPGL